MSFFPRGAALACLLGMVPLQASPSVVVTFQSLPDRVRSQNPDLAAARMRIAEAAGRMKQSGRLANPELETELEHNSRFDRGRIEVGVSQRFPLTDRLRREKAISVTELKAAEAEVENVARQLIAEAGRALVGVLAIRQQRELLREQSALTERLAESIGKAAEQGEGSLLDAGQARIDAIQIRTESRKLDAEEAAAIGALKPLLGMRPEEGLVVSGALPEPSSPSGSADVSRRPDYRAARLEVEAAADGVSLEQAKRYEDVSGGIFAAAEREDDGNEAIVGLRFSIPLPFWNRNEGAIEEAGARHRRKQLEARALAGSILHEAEAARREMLEWSKLVDEIGNRLLPLAEAQAGQAETAFNNGQTGLETVLRARAQTLRLAAARIDALRDFHLARVRHQAATGRF